MCEGKLQRTRLKVRDVVVSMYNKIRPRGAIQGH